MTPRTSQFDVACPCDSPSSRRWSGRCTTKDGSTRSSATASGTDARDAYRTLGRHQNDHWHSGRRAPPRCPSFVARSLRPRPPGPTRGTHTPASSRRPGSDGGAESRPRTRGTSARARVLGRHGRGTPRGSTCTARGACRDRTAAGATRMCAGTAGSGSRSSWACRTARRGSGRCAPGTGIAGLLASSPRTLHRPSA